MTYYRHPDAGNNGQAGIQHNGHNGMPRHGQDVGHRHGQSQLRHPYNGLHGGFQYTGDMAQSSSHSGHSEGGSLPAVVPYQQGNQLEATGSGLGKKGFSLANLGSMLNMNEIKGFVDRMGGLDGILSTVTKVQKVVGSVSQMAPLVKVLFGSFGKNGGAQSAAAGLSRPGRRRRRRTTVRPTGTGRTRRRARRRR